MGRMPPLNPIRAFEAAGRLRSVRRAAEELHVTPAAISRQVRALESYLGVRLFIRSSRAVKLTPAGEQYVSALTKSLGVIGTATAELLETHHRKVLKIRAYTAFGVRWLIPRLSSFHALHPDIQVELTTSLEPVDFERDDLDAAICLGEGTWAGLQADRLVRNELVPVCNASMVNRKPGLRSPGDLAKHLLLHSLARPDDWAKWLETANIKNVNPYSGSKYEGSLLAYQAAIEGHGVAIAQKILVEADIASGRLVMPFDLSLDMGAHTYYFVYPTMQRRRREFDLFHTWIRAVASDQLGPAAVPSQPQG